MSTAVKQVLLRQIYQLRNVDMSDTNIRNITRVHDFINQIRITLRYQPVKFKFVDRVDIPKDIEIISLDMLENIFVSLMNEYKDWVILQTKLNNHYLECVAMKLLKVSRSY